MNKDRGPVPLENLIKECKYPQANNCQNCIDCTLGKTNFDEDQAPAEKEYFAPSPESVIALRASQVLNANVEELTQMFSDMELGRLVRSHFRTSGTSMILKSDIKHLLD